MHGLPPRQNRKLRQLKYVLRQLLPKNRSKLSIQRQQDLESRFKKVYAQRRWLPLSRKLQQAAFALALSLGLPAAQAQVTFAPVAINPYNLNYTGMSVFSGDLVDLDGDGDLDFVYGAYTYGGGTGSTELFYQQNIGTATAPNFAAPVARPFGIVPNGSALLSAPQFGDLDGDGDFDMMVTTYSYYTPVGIEYYENTGTATAPAFAAPVVTPYNSNASGTFPIVNLHDIDGDGDLDLFSADAYYLATAQLNYQPNVGTATAPSFGPVQSNAFLPTNPFPSGSTATFVDFVDLDGDGDLDILANLYNYGTYSNQLGYFPNTGTATAPAFGAFVNNVYNLVLPASATTSDLIFGDVDGDGDADLIIPDRSGSFLYYENTSPLGTPPTVNLDSSSITVNEAVGTIDIDLYLSNAYPDTVRVDLLLSGTATAGQDYNLFPTNTITFAPNDTLETLSIPILDDVVVEGTEQLLVALSNPSVPALLGINDSLAVTILDNDFGVPIINFDTASYRVSEGTAVLGIPITITNPTTTPTSVEVAIGMTSTAGTGDVTFTSPARLTFGANLNTPINLSLPIVDDALYEGTEHLVLRLTNVTNGGTAGAVDSTHVEILDNETMPTVNASSTALSVNEGDGSVNVAFTLSGAVQDSASVELTVNPTSTATNGTDYTLAQPTNVLFAGGSLVASVTIPIIDDALPESVEEINLDISAPSSNILLGTMTNTQVVIRDNDSLINVAHLPQAGKIEAYPNPFSDHLTIELAEPDHKALRVVNALGQIVLDRPVQGRRMAVKTATLPAGTYWVQVYDPKTGTALWQQRLIHQ